MVDVSQSGVPSARPSRGWIDGVLGGIFALRVPFVMGVITVAALTVPDQVREIHRILTQERTVLFFNWHWVFYVNAVMLVVFAAAVHRVMEERTQATTGPAMEDA